MRPRKRINLWSFFHWLEKKVLRVLILGAVLLTVVQLGFGLITDPVDFYLAVTKQIESPPLEAVSSEQYFRIALASDHPAEVNIIQNGQIIGSLAEGVKELSVKPGTVVLDGRNIDHRVIVGVVMVDSQLKSPKMNQTYIIERNVQEIIIEP